ncbi:MAG: TIGR02444 family protein [Gammaproteobacteria bacterium]|nr:TIGR02444 family protein [Gammaproteobacteria bacterium]
MEDAVELTEGAESNPLWEYSLCSYKRAGVEAVCLTLQDEFNLNVNFLLYCCWLAAESIKISDIELLQQVKDLRYWDHEVVLPLRQARRALGKLKIKEAQVLKEKVRACELEAEEVFQDEIYASYRELNKRPDLTAGAGAPEVSAEKKAAVLASISSKRDLNNKEAEEIASRNARFSEIASHNLNSYVSIFTKSQSIVLKKNVMILVGLLEE